eukprot:SAG11_NODE_2257_length_3613_cov_1.750996_2_plen_259_part_00
MCGRVCVVSNGDSHTESKEMRTVTTGVPQIPKPYVCMLQSRSKASAADELATLSTLFFAEVAPRRETLPPAFAQGWLDVDEEEEEEEEEEELIVGDWGPRTPRRGKNGSPQMPRARTPLRRGRVPPARERAPTKQQQLASAASATDEHFLAMCGALFRQIDTDGDGQLTKKEIKKGLDSIKSGFGLATKARSVFKIADVDSSRLIDKVEFFKYMAEAVGRTPTPTLVKVTFEHAVRPSLKAFDSPKRLPTQAPVPASR